MKEAEIWIDIEGFEGCYQVSNLGRVKSLKRTIDTTNNGVKCTAIVQERIMKPGGKGGIGVVLLHNNARKELSQGYKSTTNNRMELMAVIEGFKALKGTD